jgi:hypothetical protein
MFDVGQKQEERQKRWMYLSLAAGRGGHIP